MGAAARRSDGRRDPEPPDVLLLRTGGEGVVEGAEFLVHRRVEVVEDLLPARRLVVAAGQKELPRLRLTVALAALGQEVGQVGVLRGRLLRRRRTRRQIRGVAALEHLDDGRDHFGPHLARFAHVLPPFSWSPATALPRRPEDQPPAGRMPHERLSGAPGGAAADRRPAARYDRRATGGFA